ncbi:Adaptin ear-binding coat-associated protein [Entamoeba marina]
MPSDTETQLLVIKESKLFKVLDKSGQPKKKVCIILVAVDWQQSDFIWAGKCLIVRKNNDYIIRFEDDAGVEFCCCFVEDEAVEKVLDSTLIGVGFADRGDAFDFSATLQDIERRLNKQEEIKEESGDEIVDNEQHNVTDYILAEGETITLPFSNITPINDTQDELTPLDQLNSIPTIQFDESQAQKIELKPLKTIQTTTNAVSHNTSNDTKKSTIDFTAFGSSQQNSNQNEQKPQTNNLIDFGFLDNTSTSTSTSTNDKPSSTNLFLI